MTKDRPVKVEATRPSREPAENALCPVVDIYESQGEVVVVAELPGSRREDVSVQVDKGVLTVQADRKLEVPGEGYADTYVSFESGQFFRAFALSDEIDRERISATVANGVLTVHLPKAEAAKTRKIEIRPAD